MSHAPLKTHAFRRWGPKILVVSILAPLLSIGVMIYFYLKQELDTRRTLAFMNFEQQAYRIREQLTDHGRHFLEKTDGVWQIRFQNEPRALMMDRGTRIETVFGQWNGSASGMFSPDSSALQVFRMQGQLFLATSIVLQEPVAFDGSILKDGVYRAVWRIDALFLPAAIPADAQRIYLINRDGTLIHSSIAGDSEEAILKQPLVQDFIRSPLSRAGTPLRAHKQGQYYGFYMAIPESNLTLFVESSASHFFAPLMGPTSLALGVLLSIMGLTIMVWRSAVTNLEEQSKRLAQALNEFTKGYMIPTQLSPQNFLIELQPLVESINKNTLEVRERVDLIEKTKK